MCQICIDSPGSGPCAVANAMESGILEQQQVISHEVMDSTKSDQLSADILPEEGLQSHMNRYGADITRCPVLSNLGEATLGLVMQEAEEIKSSAEVFKGMSIEQIIGGKSEKKINPTPTVKITPIIRKLSTEVPIEPILSSVSNVLTNSENNTEYRVIEARQNEIALNSQQEAESVMDIPNHNSTADVMPSFDESSEVVQVDSRQREISVDEVVETRIDVPRSPDIVEPTIAGEVETEVLYQSPIKSETSIITPILNQKIVPKTESVHQPTESQKVVTTPLETAIKSSPGQEVVVAKPFSFIQQEVETFDEPKLFEEKLEFIETAVEKWFAQTTDTLEFPDNDIDVVLVGASQELSKAKTNEWIGELVAIIQESNVIFTPEELIELDNAEIQRISIELCRVLNVKPQYHQAFTRKLIQMITLQIGDEDKRELFNKQGTSEYKFYIAKQLQTKSEPTRPKGYTHLSRYILSKFTDHLAFAE